jgi:1,2-phenylacetyl-CoA epoxidase PaaB subunit
MFRRRDRSELHPINMSRSKVMRRQEIMSLYGAKESGIPSSGTPATFIY